MKLKKSNILISVFIFIIFFNISNQIQPNKNINYITNEKKNNSLPKPSLSDHAPININGNGNLLEINGVKDESALGTFDDPYIIENYSISSGGSTGIYLKDTTAFVIIRNCIITGSSNYGIYINNGGNITIQNCSITDFSSGIRLYQCKNATVHKNYADDQSHAGILFEECNNCTTQDNEVEHSWDWGIEIQNSENCTIINNRCHHNDYGGIYLNNADYCLIKDNRNRLNLIGILIYNTNACELVENYFSNNERYGIQFSSGNSNNSVHHNIITYNYEHGIYLYTYQNNEIYSNDLSLNGQGPFTYSQSYSDDLFDNTLKRSNEMKTSNLPEIDVEDKTNSYYKEYSLSIFDTGSAGEHELVFEFSCEKKNSDTAIFLMEANIYTLSGYFYQLSGASFLFNISLSYKNKEYIAFGYRTSSTGTVLFSSKIYSFPMCSQEVSLDSPDNEYLVSFSYVCESSKWDTVNSTFSELITLEFDDDKKDDSSSNIPGYDLPILIISLLGLIFLSVKKVKKINLNLSSKLLLKNMMNNL